MILIGQKQKIVASIFPGEKANQACAFIELLPHVEGVWDPPTLVLHPAQCFLLFSFSDLELRVVM